jgi:hypothetical protein
MAKRIAHAALEALSLVELSVIVGSHFLQIPWAKRLRKYLSHRLGTFRRHDYEIGSAMLVQQLPAAAAGHKRITMAIDAVHGVESTAASGMQHADKAAFRA